METDLVKRIEDLLRKDDVQTKEASTFSMGSTMDQETRKLFERILKELKN